MGETAPVPSVDDVDRLYGELRVIARRLSRACALAAAGTQAGGRLSRVAELLGTAEAAVDRALLAVPELAAPASGPPSLLTVGPLRVEVSTRRVTFDGRTVELSRLEYGLLVHMAREPMRVFGKDELLQAVWSYGFPVTTRTVDSHASRLRGKLARAGAERGSWVVNVWGVGYALRRDAPPLVGRPS